MHTLRPARLTAIIAFVGLWGASAVAEVGIQVMPCDLATTAPNCTFSATLDNFDPTPLQTPIIIGGSTLHIVGLTELYSTYARNAVVLDISLQDGHLEQRSLYGASADSMSYAELSPDGRYVLAGQRYFSDQDTLSVFDVDGIRRAQITGYVASAFLARFGQNVIRFDGDTAYLKTYFPSIGQLTEIELELFNDRLRGAQTAPDDAAVYEMDFVDGWQDSWQQGEAYAITQSSGDGIWPSITIHWSADPDNVMRIDEGNSQFEYDNPMMSPDGRHVAFLRLGQVEDAPTQGILFVYSAGNPTPVWQAPATADTMFAWGPNSDELIMIEPRSIRARSENTRIMAFRPFD